MKYILRPIVFCCWIVLLGSCAFEDQMPPEGGISLDRFAISGKILGNNIDPGNITIELAGAQLPGRTRRITTGPDGSYRFDNIPIGSYTLTPSKSGLFFSPRSRTSNVVDIDVDEQDFTAFQSLVTLVTVPGGSFKMGSDRWLVEERPVRTVRVNAFQISPYEVTQKQWQIVLNTNPSYFQGKEHPVEQVTWLEAIRFCNQLSEREGLGQAYTIIDDDEVLWNYEADGYRLPTEAEWEFACRAGTNTDTYEGDLSSNSTDCFDEPILNRIARYCDPEGKHQPVGQKKPNALGLYDMLGNVAEWCWDWYENYYTGESDNPRGPEFGTLKVYRGGSAFYQPYLLRSAARKSLVPHEMQKGLGLRVARSLR